MTYTPYMDRHHTIEEIAQMAEELLVDVRAILDDKIWDFTLDENPDWMLEASPSEQDQLRSIVNDWEEIISAKKRVTEDALVSAEYLAGEDNPEAESGRRLINIDEERWLVQAKESPKTRLADFEEPIIYIVSKLNRQSLHSYANLDEVREEAGRLKLAYLGLRSLREHGEPGQDDREEETLREV